MNISISNAGVVNASDIRALLYGVGNDHMICDDIWKWEFFGQCANPIIKIAYDGVRRKIAGHYAMIPLKFNFRGNVHEGGKIEGSAVEEAYRGRNLALLYPQCGKTRIFRELVLSMAAEIKSREIDVVFGFPNEAASRTQYESFPKADFAFRHYTKVYDARALMREKIATSGKLRRMAIYSILWLNAVTGKKMNDKGKYIVADYDPALHDIEELSNAFIRMKDVISIHRDSEYIKWRYLKNPVQKNTIKCAIDRDGLLCGMIAFGYCDRKACREGVVSDILYNREDGELVEQLVAVATRSLEENGVAFISGINVGEKFKLIDRAYRKAGYFYKVRKQLNFFYTSEEMRKYGVDLLDINNWYVNFSFRQGV